jgi:hypothetical protein
VLKVPAGHDAVTGALLDADAKGFHEVVSDPTGERAAVDVTCFPVESSMIIV